MSHKLLYANSYIELITEKVRNCWLNQKDDEEYKNVSYQRRNKGVKYFLKKLRNKSRPGFTLDQCIENLQDNILNKTINSFQYEESSGVFIYKNKNAEHTQLKTEYEGEYLYEIKGRESVEFHVRIAFNCFSNGRPYFLIQFTDISEKVKAQEAKVADKIKTMMLCSISHELRTPLNQIKGMVDLSKNEKDIPKIHEYLKIADRASNMLLHKIDDILDFYEIEAGKFVEKES